MISQPSVRDRARGYLWIAVAIAEFAIAAWGVLAIVDPEILGAGFETHTGESWRLFSVREAAAASFMTIAFRLIGALSVVAGVLLVSVAVTGFRNGERWAWWTLLIGNTMAFGAPMIYDRAVGFIGIFEALEYVALLVVYLALAAQRRSQSGLASSSEDRAPFDARTPA